MRRRGSAAPRAGSKLTSDQSMPHYFDRRWWSEQTPERQALVKQLVANGQLVFANGGWCMHDEVRTTDDLSSLAIRCFHVSLTKDSIRHLYVRNPSRPTPTMCP